MHNSRRHRAGGFTLIETLVAGIILALAIAVMSTAISHAYSALGESRDERRAAALLDDLLTKIDLIGPARIANEGPHNGNFDGGDERFSWTADIQNRPQGHLFQVTVTVSWTEAGKSKSATIDTYLNDPPKSRDSTLKWRDL
jgi:type II secretory pathway pseudopilin PulG